MPYPLSHFRRSSLALALLLAVAPPLRADNSNPPQEQAADKDDKGGKKKGPASDLRGLPNVDTGSTAVDASPGTGVGSRDDRAGAALAGATGNGSAAQLRQDATGGLNGSITQRPGFDQGFSQTNQEALAKQAEQFKASNGNPLTAVTGGRPNDGAGPTGIAAQGTGAISAGVTSGTGAGTSKDGEVETKLTKEGADALAKKHGVSSEGVLGALGISGERKKALDAAECEPNCAEPAAPATPAATPEAPLNTAANPNLKLFPSGASSEKSDDGNTVTHTTADGKVVTVITTDPATGKKTVEKTTTNDDGTKTTTHDDGTTTTTAATDKTGTSCRGLDGCKDTAGKAEFLKNNPGIAAQVNQARNGAAGGEVNPDRQGSVAVDRSIAVPTSSQVGRNLFGQPAAAGTTSGGAGRSGTDFNGGAGAIDPGPDAVIAGSGRQDDPGNFFNSQPSPQGGPVQAPPATSKDCAEKKPATKRLIAVATAKAGKKDDCAK
ncbi:MAG: hypothetical protein V4650_12850 [Pseudomonadota bacterium]